jgi:uncharacterized protein YndB with AHSA1/START domain
MTDLAPLDPYGVLTDPATLRIQRLLPATIDRCWAYLTDSDLRRQWLASGVMGTAEGAPVTLTWRNEHLNDPPSQRPEGADEEHSMDCVITAYDPPRKLGITWGSTGGVTFELEPRTDGTLLTVTHHRVTDRGVLLSVSGGWHSHLDILAARIAGKTPPPFWPLIAKLKPEYEARLGG